MALRFPSFVHPPGKDQSASGYSTFPYTNLLRAKPRDPRGQAVACPITALRRGGDDVTFQKGTDNKTAQVRIRFTPDEKAQAEALAKEGGLTLSEYIRRRALGLPVRSKADAQMINELRRLGGLVKHIHNQTDGVNSKETAGVLVSITEAIKRIGD